MNFSNTLIHWYLQNKRDLPWRNTVNPYQIWLSEIMLQQTRVAQGLPYFLKFIDRFPTVFDLANADEQEVLKLWQGLGYYSRARNLHKTSQIVALNFEGKFPDNYNDLLELKGIGEYTAAAIASFAYNENVPVVDGNVFRVLSRYFNIETDIASSGAKKEFTALAKELLPDGKTNLFNQAIMEFGALQCVPKNPNCENCVLNSSCLALKFKKVSDLPIKLKKTKVQKRFFNYLIFKDAIGNTILQKRTQKGIWHNLYEFSLIETLDETSDLEVMELIERQNFIKNQIENIKLLNPIKINHKLSHQHLSVSFWEVQVEGKIENGIDYKSALNFPFPIVIYNFISKNWK
ncbi:A/G-specific adenine glycosylase [Flavobacterium capsici]|uniref:Adenine DNA glycosylase n=1 Tax=Flavobacterium capsici TaxID=3075618 RepID=A0AA96EYB0_9FLAO|nr:MULTISPECIES: A/G-specific adenine glycosylase [unclassified Flavobacterium]WNM19409.1 A/G-specific adenine glycosylase [Flavobacterium sp. PMR2A8]WNM20799.1 A/G-specific adenine glycosylase [Flavobacterium sp. PMTSA4]